MRVLGAVIAVPVLISAGTLGGRFVWPSGVSALRNGTLTLTLSQAAVVPGSFALVPTSVTCYTSTDGSVVGVPNPQALPVLHAITGTGSLAAGNYFVVFTYSGAGGETLVSPEQAVPLTATGEITVDPPTLQPTGSTWNVYIGTSSGAETRQGAALAYSTYTQATSLVAGAAQPGTNSSTCTLQFNDATTPTPTYYAVSLADASGSALPGYPQNWYLSGTSVDVSNVVPLSYPPSVRFALPVVQNPPSAQPQSIASPIQMNGYSINGASNVGPSLLSSFTNGTLPAAPATLLTWTPNAAITLKRLSAFAAVAGSGGTNGISLQITDGTSMCTFGQLAGVLAGSATSGSVAAPVGTCNFSAGLPLLVKSVSDDHVSRPANVTITVELVAQ